MLLPGVGRLVARAWVQAARRGRVVVVHLDLAAGRGQLHRQLDGTRATGTAAVVCGSATRQEERSGFSVSCTA
ncbi:hypothetical protein GCM10010346_21790 [Streptomyces chryseus]|uniref:Uncharacterized protein n=1 Tax=Streptomyces chryseus TaxID=68186 RepID=A0ABQ3DQL6_9ACTN|nr:hypothetical protein GCM10010346_21790 [Streptomyces chryseus]